MFDWFNTALMAVGCVVLMQTFITAGLAVHCPEKFINLSNTNTAIYTVCAVSSYSMFLAAALARRAALALVAGCVAFVPIGYGVRLHLDPDRPVFVSPEITVAQQPLLTSVLQSEPDSHRQT